MSDKLEKIVKEREELIKTEKQLRKQPIYFFDYNEEVYLDLIALQPLIEKLLSSVDSTKKKKDIRKDLTEAFKNLGINDTSFYSKTKQCFSLATISGEYMIMNTERENRGYDIDFMLNFMKYGIGIFCSKDMFHFVNFKSNKEMTIVFSSCFV